MRRIGCVVSVVLSAVVAGACGSEQGDEGVDALLTVTDSLGVEIVVNRIPPEGLPVFATLDSMPDLSLGFIRGDDTSYLFDVAGAVTLSNGDVVVADGRSLQVRFYSHDGTSSGWMGGQGLDDGEFWTLSRLGRMGGDTVWAADHARDRLTTLGKEAGLVAVHALPSGYSVAGRFGDGSFLLVPRWPVALHKEDPVDGVRRDPAQYLRWWAEKGDTVAVGVFPHDQIVVVETQQGLSAGVPPFGRKTVQAVGPGRFYVGTQGGFVIGSYDPDGTLRQSIRLEGLDFSLSPEQVAAARSGRASTQAERELVDRFWATVPESRPAHGRILLDAAGNLWVAEHVATMDPPRNWMVFGPDGGLRGLVTVPKNLALQEIGLRYILGVARSLGGDERVVRYRLNRLR